MKRQSGFTLIELVMVIVILGILAATALPKFVNLSSDAEIAATQGLAGAIAGGNTINYANFSLHGIASAVVVTGDCTTTAEAASLLDGGMPAGYTSVVSGAAATVVGTTAHCALRSPNFANNAAASAVYVLTRTQ